MNTENAANIIKTVGAAFAALAGFLFGPMDNLFYAFLAFVAIDYLSGVASAVINRKLSSRIGFCGILKKLLFLAVVAVGHILDIVMGGNGVLRNAVIGFLLANEGISILENCAKCGLPIPKVLVNALTQLKETEGEETDPSKEKHE